MSRTSWWSWLVATLALCPTIWSCEAAEGVPSEVVTVPCEADESLPVPPREQPGTWQRIDIPGAACSDGSTYPIFVNYSASSNNLLVVLEPGGACWDYQSCSPEGGVRGAANPAGIADGIAHMTRWQVLPLLRPDVEVNPVHDWNKVFLPYCTGDIHVGSKQATYHGPNGETLRFGHNGHDNITRTVEWLDTAFTAVPKLLVTGCSAGGAGALLNYPVFRQGIQGVQCSYLLNDSGPIFASHGNSAALHEEIRSAWNADAVLESLADGFPAPIVEDIRQDFGLLNLAIADAYPQDRLTIAVYQRDLNYSLYSYERFFDFPPYTRIHALWDEDVAALRLQYDTRNNLSYYMPYFRTDNCSHCASIPPIGLDGSDLRYAFAEPWRGSEVEADHVTLRDYVIHLLDDTQPLTSHLESERPETGFTPEEVAVCQGG